MPRFGVLSFVLRSICRATLKPFIGFWYCFNVVLRSICWATLKPFIGFWYCVNVVLRSICARHNDPCINIGIGITIGMKEAAARARSRTVGECASRSKTAPPPTNRHLLPDGGAVLAPACKLLAVARQWLGIGLGMAGIGRGQDAETLAAEATDRRRGGAKPRSASWREQRRGRREKLLAMWQASAGPRQRHHGGSGASS